MKTKTTITLLTSILLSFNLLALKEPDSIYIHFTASDASDSIVAYALADIDSIVYYAPALPQVPQDIDWDNATEGEVQFNALTDADGKSYSAVKIGTQVWMAENLVCASGIYTEDNSSWSALRDNDTDAAYCYLENETSNRDTYGALYTYAAALSACPAEWHLPSDDEWKALEMTLGMSEADADKTGGRGTNNEGSKLAGNSDLWTIGNLTANSEFGTSGFSALPGGIRDRNNGSFGGVSQGGAWWSSTQTDSSNAYRRTLSYINSSIVRYEYSKSYGFSVRCVRD